MQGVPKNMNYRGIRTDTKLRSLTKIDFNVMHLVKKMQIRGSGDLQNLVFYPASILGLQLHGILV